MSEYAFRCPECGSEFDRSGAVHNGAFVEIVLSCYQCPHNWSVGADPEDFQRL